MMSKPLTRLLSLVLALTMFISSVPFARAEEEIVADPIPVETVEATEAPAAEETEAATEPVAEPEETVAATEPAAEPEETVAATEPAAEPEETEPATEPAAEPEETEPATEPAIEETEPATEPEETEPATEPAEIELPYGFNGMPEGYELSEEELAAKQDLTAYDTVTTLNGLTAGKEYAADEVIFLCDSEEYAQMVAYAYNAELVDYSFGVAQIRLQSATVMEAVGAAADMELPLPAVSPNYITAFDPVYSNGDISDAIDLYALPERQSWETWVMENLANPDPAIANPRAENYQYFHDVINSYEAWGVTTGREDVKVAVIDSGVWNHIEFDGDNGSRLWRIDVGLGYDDDVGHGTHVAGIIAGALDNGKGGAGVAPGVTIYSYKAGDANGLPDLYIARSIKDAADRGIDIINMSLGGAYATTIIREAVAYANRKGVTIVAAMGNDGTNCIQYPAAYDGVIAVVSTDATNRRAYYSNFGAWADVCAPGSDIYSTVPGSYGYKSGTSMATPVVAGVCALYMSAVGHVSPAEMEKVLEKNCKKISDKEVGAGIVDVGKMFDKIVTTPSVVVGTYVDSDGYAANCYNPKNNATVNCDEYIDFLINAYDENATVIYTINGKTPSVKNGAVVNGIQYHGAISLAPYVGQTITVRVAAVTGMGSISKVTTLKLKVVESKKVESLTIIAPQKILAGKSVQLTAAVKPAKADQAVTWSIVHRTGDTAGVTIAANGTLKTQPKKSGTVTVQAVSKADGRFVDTRTIQIETINPVATIKLDKTTANIYTGEGVQIFIATLQDKLKNDIASSDCGIQWTSSNKKVATVNEYGYVTGLTKGKVTITCKVLDGSGKSAKCTVNVLQAVESITITGNDTIPAGVSATYKAVAAPTTANNKNVTWELIGAPYGSTISAKGAVKIPAGTATGTSFKIRATAKDTGWIYGEKTVYVSPKTSSVLLDCVGGYYGGVTYNSKTGSVSAANLFVSDVAVGAATREWVQFSYYTVGNDYTPVEWTTSNAKVATVSPIGIVEAHNPGTATITCKALDGSGKKATVKVTVTVPVSQIKIKSSAPQMTSGDPCIAFGKSVKNTVVFGDTYGKPSNTKVSWDFRVLLLNTSSGQFTLDYTNYCKSTKLVSVSGGTLKVGKGMKNLWLERKTNEEFVIAVTATAMDGSGVSDTIYYYTQPGATVLGIYDYTRNGVVYYTKSTSRTYRAVTDEDQGYYTVRIICDQRWIQTAQGILHFTTTSSNPKVASVYSIEPVSGKKGHYDVVIVAQSPGNANIVVKTADGTNLSTTIKVKVVR